MVNTPTGKKAKRMSEYKAIWQGVFGLMAVLLVWAFLASGFFRDSGMLSLIPPATWEVPDPAPDVASGKTLALYQSAFTAWVALILLIPVYLSIWFSERSSKDYAVWLSFWSASYVAYLVHLFVSMVLFFEGDIAAMTSSSRVSAFWPGMAIIVLWGGDVLLAFRGGKGILVSIFRGLVHLLVFVLFFGGSAVKGELTVVNMLGIALLAAGVTGMTVWLRHKTRKVT